MEGSVLIFIFNLVTHYILLGMVVFSILQPKHRIWPPIKKNSWQYKSYWGLFYGSVFLDFVIFLQSFDSWVIASVFQYGLGIIMISIGGFILLKAIATLGIKNTYGLKDKFVEEGIYKFSRNPQYVGDIVLLFGLILFCNSLELTLFFSLEILMFLLMPFSEEIWLEEVYGKKYLIYKEKTTRFI